MNATDLISKSFRKYNTPSKIFDFASLIRVLSGACEITKINSITVAVIINPIPIIFNVLMVLKLMSLYINGPFCRQPDRPVPNLIKLF